MASYKQKFFQIFEFLDGKVYFSGPVLTLSLEMLLFFHEWIEDHSVERLAVTFCHFLVTFCHKERKLMVFQKKFRNTSLTFAFDNFNAIFSGRFIGTCLLISYLGKVGIDRAELFDSRKFFVDESLRKRIENPGFVEGQVLLYRMFPAEFAVFGIQVLPEGRKMTQ